MRRARGRVRPDKSNQDGFAINRVLGEKLTPSILEFADLGWVKDAILAIGPIESPLVGLRVVQTQRQTFDVPRVSIDLDRVQLRAPIPNLVADARTLKLNPASGTCQRMQLALQVIFPAANQGIKIVLPIALRDIG